MNYSDGMGKIASTFQYSPVDLWRENIHGGWATLLALLFILICHYFSANKHFPFLSRFRTYVVHSENSNCNYTTVSDLQNSHFKISEFVSDNDLKFLIENLDGRLNENERWENVIEKKNNLVYYNAKCCKPKDAPLKYTSVTVFENCCPEMLRDFYMDNDYRMQWDKTMVLHQQLQVDKSSGVEVGRTLKKFPLLTPREYVLSWRLWEGKDRTYYCFIKECEHPVAPWQKKYVRVKLFRSGWRIRKVFGRNACEIKMFHQEDAGLNVEMAKLAFSRGIWSYVCKMDNALRKYSLVHLRSSSASTEVALMAKVPPGIDGMDGKICQATPAAAVNEIGGQISDAERKQCKRPSRKMLANGLLLLGGVICLSRGHSSLGAKVAMAYVLTKLSKRGPLSGQRE